MKKGLVYLSMLMLMVFGGSEILAAGDKTPYIEDTQLDRYGGWKNIKGDVTGFFHVQKINDNWWFITPEGNSFLSIGVNTVSPKGDFAPKVRYSPYEKNVNNKYGRTENWIKTTLVRLKEWGFNTIGAFSVPVDRRQSEAEAIPYILTYALGDLGGANWQKGIFPDVFAPRFKEEVDKAVRSRSSRVNQDPFLVGYFLDNELHWTNAVDSIARLGFNAPGKQALIEFAKKRYQNDFSKFKEVWETGAKDFGELARTKEIKPKKAFAHRAREDRDEFLRIVARRYFEITTNAVRSHDKNHLILGVRFFSPTPRVVVEEIGRHVDVVSINYYPKTKDEDKTEGYSKWTEQMARAGMIADKDWFKEYEELTKKPILITEFSFTAKDSGLPNRRTKHEPSIALPSQRDRADMFEWFAKRSATTPYIVGYHWFQYMDQPKEGRFDGQNYNFGLVDIQDNPYYPLVDRMKIVNKEVYLLHR